MHPAPLELKSGSLSDVLFEKAGKSSLRGEKVFISLVDWDKCTGCGECINACPVNCFKMENGKSLPHRSSYCIDCGTCKEVCPADAITISIGWGGFTTSRAS